MLNWPDFLRSFGRYLIDETHHNRSGQTASGNPPCVGEEKDPRDDPAHYVLRIFYYNPGDPAVMVPMRWGRGIDFNYARWPGKTIVTVLLQTSDGEP